LFIVTQQAAMPIEKRIKRNGARQSECLACRTQIISPVVIETEFNHTPLGGLRTLAIGRPPAERIRIEFTNPPAFTSWEFRVLTHACRRIIWSNTRENGTWRVGLEMDARSRRYVGEHIEVACNKPDHIRDAPANQRFTTALLSGTQHSFA